MSAPFADTSSEGPSEPAGNGLRRRTPNWRSHREMTGQGPSDPDNPVTLLIELAFREPGVCQPSGKPAVYTRMHGFHGVIGEGSMSGFVPMKDTQAWIKPGTRERDGHLTCKNGIKVIQDGVRGGHGMTCVLLPKR
jgi:hypothetical protein